MSQREVILTELEHAKEECERLINELDRYDWQPQGSYIVGLGTPLPEEDIDHFHELSRQATLVKKRILIGLEAMGPDGEKWVARVRSVQFCERYLDDPLGKNALRPKRDSL